LAMRKETRGVEESRSPRVSEKICGRIYWSGRVAHARNLMYVSELMERYFTREKVMDTQQLCEENGINTNVAHDGALHLITEYNKERGGKMQAIGQLDPNSTVEGIKKAVGLAKSLRNLSGVLYGDDAARRRTSYSGVRRRLSMRKTEMVWWLSVMLLTAAIGCTTHVATDKPVQAPGGPVALFDGKTFTGWEGNLEWFRIEDGVIVAGSLERAIPRNEFLCTTKEYGDFELRLQAKLIGDGANAGIQFRSRRVPNHHEVSGYQADMAAEDDRNIWGALYDESRRNRMLVTPDQEALARVFRPNDWNELVIRCEGPRIQIWLNGHQTVDYTETDKSIESTGIIGLQVHGGPPSEASYRDIVIEELS